MSTTTNDAKLQRVLDMPSIAQRTPEWYAARHNLITASSCADALGLNPYNRNARQVLLETKGTPGECLSGPMGNVFTIHGTRFECIFRMSIGSGEREWRGQEHSKSKISTRARGPFLGNF